jgi:hypothetical protein
MAWMSKYRFPALSSIGTRILSEIPCLHFDRIDKEIGTVDVARSQGTVKLI